MGDSRLATRAVSLRGPGRVRRLSASGSAGWLPNDDPGGAIAEGILDPGGSAGRAGFNSGFENGGASGGRTGRGGVADGDGATGVAMASSSTGEIGFPKMGGGGGRTGGR